MRLRAAPHQDRHRPGNVPHQHVPENDHGDHGDPDDIDMARVMADARSTADETPDDEGSDDGAAGTYTVKKGDTLSSIARAHDITWRYLAGANGLRARPHAAHAWRA
ncbi:LysM peptidoglycan-binding domain-containing protein [Streptomyces reniochalinae]|uniref:LysM peptidoglycan-binding domain-containing protein n=1 Tax=Streptomyces reniochalinae TaxID=2250578 RepID=UPI001C68C190|nr:LysM peptidoglycan-binding domain-containing protein [Streptomyces reniochalinae]